MARQRRPVVPPEVSSYIVDSYVRLRKMSKEDEKANKSHTYTSARTLLGVLRLAQALARLRFADSVEHSDIDEALRLMECSKESLQDDDEKEFGPDKSIVSQIYRLIKSMGGTKGRRKRQKRMGKGPGGERDMDIDSDENEDDETLSMVDIRARVLNAGFTELQLAETIRQVSNSSLCPALILTDALVNSMKSWISGSQSITVPSSSSIPYVVNEPSYIFILLLVSWCNVCRCNISFISWLHPLFLDTRRFCYYHVLSSIDNISMFLQFVQDVGGAIKQLDLINTMNRTKIRTNEIIVSEGTSNPGIQVILCSRSTRMFPAFFSTRART